MTAIYLLSEKNSAQKEHGRMVIEFENGNRQGIPLGDVDHLVLGRHAHVTIPLIFALIEQGAIVSLIDGSGKTLASMGGESMSLRRLLCQHDYFTDTKTQLLLVRWLIREKIRRQQRIVKSYASRKKSDMLKTSAKELRLYQKNIETFDTIEALRGCEGMAARVYFDAFTEILNQHRWPWVGRSRRPASDPVNALLNLGYAFLEREVRFAIVDAHLDPRLGFFHANNERKDSLVYDLMELFRQTVADRLILRLLNYGSLMPKDFHHDEKTGCRLSENAYLAWCAAYEDYMEKPVQDYGGKTPREKIRNEIGDFARNLFKNEDVARLPKELNV